MAVVDTLEIQVTGKGVQELVSAMNRLSAAMAKVKAPATQTAKVISKTSAAAKKASSGFGQLLASLKRIAVYRLIRGAIKAITEAFSEGAENAYWFAKAVGDDLATSLDGISTASFKMSNQMGAAWATLLQTIQPIILAIINLVTRAFQVITQFFAVLGGRSTYLKAIDYTKEWAKSTAGGAKAAKEWKNQLLGFDEINKLEAPSDNGGGGGGGLPDYSKMFEETPLDDWAQKVKTCLAAIEMVAGGLMLGLGLLLLVTGANVPLGLGLIVAGAATLAASVKANWELIPTKVTETLATIMLIAGSGLMGIGLIALLTGHPGIGLGMILAGMASITAVGINWDNMPENVRNTLGKISRIVGASLFAIGLIVALAFNPALGLGIMGAGFAMYSATTIDWNSMPKTVGEVLERVHAKWDDFKTKLQNIKDKIRQIINDIKAVMDKFTPKIRMPHLSVSYEPVDSSFWRFFGVSNVPRVSISWAEYATGGFPKAGQLFVANEAGAEMVGSMDGKTAVANNEQIVEGIRSGVYDAVVSAMGSIHGEQIVKVYLDSKEIKAGQTRLARAMG